MSDEKRMMSAKSDDKSKLLDVQDLTMRFGQNTVLRKISFHINEGETYGLVGESGSGKSTVGKCIIGLHRPSAGLGTK